jgi:hypothetical protein
MGQSRSQRSDPESVAAEPEVLCDTNPNPNPNPNPNANPNPNPNPNANPNPNPNPDPNPDPNQAPAPRGALRQGGGTGPLPQWCSPAAAALPAAVRIEALDEELEVG